MIILFISFSYGMTYYKRYRLLQRQIRELAASSSSEEDLLSQPLQTSSSPHRENPVKYCQNDVAMRSLDSSDSSDFEFSFSEDSDSDDTGGNNPFSDTILSEELATWASQFDIKRQALNGLLEILRKSGHNIPKDGRTLLQTPRYVTVRDKSGGKYSYFGITSRLQLMLSHNPDFVKDHDSVRLSVNIDGIPLYKSSPDQLWPILIKFDSFQPIVVALYCGKEKPNCVYSYLQDFLEEFRQLSQDGVVVDGKKLNVSIHSFVCDAPARCFIK